jgi:hypothetical protein
MRSIRRLLRRGWYQGRKYYAKQLRRGGRQMSIDYFDIEELLSAMYGITDEQRNDGFDFDELLYEKFDIGFEEFSKLFRSCCH